jgi:PAS domain S-box-containing protein
MSKEFDQQRADELMTLRQRIAEMEHALEHRSAQFALINDVSNNIAAVLTLDEVFDRAVQLILDSFGYHHVALFTLDLEGSHLEMRARVGDFADLFPADHRLTLGQGIVGWVGSHVESFLSNEVSIEPRYVNLYPDLIPTRSELSVPIQMGGELLGVLDVQSPLVNAFDENDVLVIETIADQVAVAIENARLYAAVQQELEERQRVERETQERRLYLEGVLSAAPDAIVTLDRHHNVVEWNPGAESLFGYMPDEAVGRDLDQLICRSDVLEEAVALTSAVLSGQSVAPRETLRYRKDGSPVDVILAGSPILLGDELIGSVAVYTDITERVRAEKTLSQRAVELRAVALVSAALRDAHSVEEMVSVVLSHTVGVLGATYGTIFLTEPETDELVARACHPPGLYPLGMRHHRDEGITGYVATTGEMYVTEHLPSDPLADIRPEEAQFVIAVRRHVSVPLRTQESTVGVMHIGWSDQRLLSAEDMRLLASIADIAANALNRASVMEGLEAEVMARTAEIRAEKEKSEAILRSVGDAIGMFNVQQRIEYVNEAFSALTGYSAEEVIGQQTDLVVAAKLPDWEWQALQKAIATGAVWRGEATIRRKDGRTYDAATTIAPVRDMDGDPIGFVSSHRDISRLKALDRARRQFITSISHELRTPLTSLQLYLSLLQDEDQSERASRYLELTVDQTKRLIRLTEDILEITALDSGDGARDWKTVCLSTVVETAVACFQDHAAVAELTLTIKPFPPDLPSVRGDQARLTQALVELLENAVIFTPNGGHIAVAVQRIQHEGQTWLTIAVQDDGPGIPEEEQERVFDRFFRGSLVETGTVPGTGLGLSIVWEIMQAHGGRVTVDSKEGQGSVFALWLRTVS